jgi:autophagy-related protein 9
VYFLEELLSAFITPMILCFQLRRKSLQIIDFLRNFTVDVQGVGDVCSFAQLDVAKHGDMKVKTTTRNTRNRLCVIFSCIVFVFIY